MTSHSARTISRSMNATISGRRPSATPIQLTKADRRSNRQRYRLLTFHFAQAQVRKRAIAHAHVAIIPCLTSSNDIRSRHRHVTSRHPRDIPKRGSPCSYQARDQSKGQATRRAAGQPGSALEHESHQSAARLVWPEDWCRRIADLAAFMLQSAHCSLRRSAWRSGRSCR